MRRSSRYAVLIFGLFASLCAAQTKFIPSRSCPPYCPPGAGYLILGSGLRLDPLTSQFVGFQTYPQVCTQEVVVVDYAQNRTVRLGSSAAGCQYDTSCPSLCGFDLISKVNSDYCPLHDTTGTIAHRDQLTVQLNQSQNWLDVAIEVSYAAVNVSGAARLRLTIGTPGSAPTVISQVLTGSPQTFHIGDYLASGTAKFMNVELSIQDAVCTHLTPILIGETENYMLTMQRCGPTVAKAAMWPLELGRPTDLCP